MDHLTFTKAVRDNDALRASFNALTRATFCFDFTDWYDAGHWGDLYVPHVLEEGGKVISNISVNHMVFDLNGAKKYYIQLGTVMTHKEHQGQGLNRKIMEKILRDYSDKVDGFYLFGNDSVLDYYPKFGFKPVKETEYFMAKEQFAAPYALEKSDADRLCTAVSATPKNPNDGLYMCDNQGLYRFWCAAEYDENIYFLPEVNAHIVATTDGNQLQIHQIVSSQKINLRRLAGSFGSGITEAVLRFTPTDPTGLKSRNHKEEDCTLFILGNDLSRIEKDGLIFPTLSHA